MTEETRSKTDELLERRRQRLERLAAKRAAANSPSISSSVMEKPSSKDSLPKVEDDNKSVDEKQETTENEILSLEKLMQSVVDTNKDDMAEVKLDEDSDNKLSLNISSPLSSSNSGLLSPIKEGEKKESRSQLRSSDSSRRSSQSSSPSQRRTSRSSLRSDDDSKSTGRRRSARNSEILERSERERERRERERERDNEKDRDSFSRRRSTRNSDISDKDSDRNRERDRERRRQSRSQQLSDILASASANGIISKSDSKSSSERRRSRMEDIELKLQEVRNRRESKNLKRNNNEEDSSSSDIDSIRERAKNIINDKENESTYHKEIEEKSKQSIDSPELIALRNRISRLVHNDTDEEAVSSPRQKRQSALNNDDIDPKIKALLSKRSSLDASLIKDLPGMGVPDSDRSLLRKSFQFNGNEEIKEVDDSVEYPETKEKSTEIEKSPIKTGLSVDDSANRTPAASPIRTEIKTEIDDKEKETEVIEESHQITALPSPPQEKEDLTRYTEDSQKEESESLTLKNEYDEHEFDGNYKRLNSNNERKQQNSRSVSAKPVSEFMKDDMGPEGEDEFWESMITEFKDYFMDIPSYVLQKIRGGIPHHLRGKVWKVMSGADNNDLDTLYEQLLLEESPFEKQILRDVARTFPHMSMFSERNGEGQHMLFNLMKAYSLYDTEVGYCQGLCFIVGPLLMQRITEKEAFSIFVRLMEETESKPENELEENTEDTRQTRRYAFRSLFTPRMPGVNLMMYQFDYFLKTYLPALYGHLLRHNVVSTMYASQWFLTIFAYNFPLPLVFRIFDILFAEGPGVTILRFSFAILRRNQSRLLEMESFEELLEFLKGNKIFEIYGEGRDAHNDVVNDAMSMCNIICETELRKLRQEFERTDDGNQVANHGGEMELLSARMTLRELRQQRNYDHNLIEELKTQIEVLSEEVNEARRDVDPLRDENESLRVQCHELKELLTNEDRRLQSIWEDTVRKIEQENARLKFQLQKAENQLIDAKVLMANMEDEKDMLINSIRILKNTFGANEVTQALNAHMQANKSKNSSQHSLRRSDSLTSNRSNRSNRSQQQGNSSSGGWFNNVSNAISSYMEQRQSHSNATSTTGNTESINMEMNEEPVSEVQDTQQQASRWKFGWNK
ncbi:rab-GTPase-TBC domain-containing protein [Neocallimastix sp. 'constans']|jgi:hypothetical protein